MSEKQPCTKPGCPCSWPEFWHDMGPAPHGKRSVRIGELIDETESMVLIGFGAVGLSGAIMGVFIGWLLWGPTW